MTKFRISHSPVRPTFFRQTWQRFGFLVPSVFDTSFRVGPIGTASDGFSLVLTSMESAWNSGKRTLRRACGKWQLILPPWLVPLYTQLFRPLCGRMSRPADERRSHISALLKRQASQSVSPWTLHWFSLSHRPSRVNCTSDDHTAVECQQRCDVVGSHENIPAAIINSWALPFPHCLVLTHFERCVIWGNVCCDVEKLVIGGKRPTEQHCSTRWRTRRRRVADRTDAGRGDVVFPLENVFETFWTESVRGRTAVKSTAGATQDRRTWLLAVQISFHCEILPRSAAEPLRSKSNVEKSDELLWMEHRSHLKANNRQVNLHILSEIDNATHSHTTTKSIPKWREAERKTKNPHSEENL